MHRLNTYEVPQRTERDVTTDVAYIFTSKNLNPRARLTDKNWLCYRTNVANGSITFANGVDDFVHRADLAATYTYDTGA